VNQNNIYKKKNLSIKHLSHRLLLPNLEIIHRYHHYLSKTKKYVQLVINTNIPYSEQILKMANDII